MCQIFIKIKDIISQSEFLKTFMTIGVVAASGLIIYNVGKVVGKLIAEFGLF